MSSVYSSVPRILGGSVPTPPVDGLFQKCVNLDAQKQWTQLMAKINLFLKCYVPGA